MGQKILALHDGHNASAAIFDGATLIAAVSEERLNREKFYWGFPERSIQEVLRIAKLSSSDIDVLTVSHLSTLGYIGRKLTLRGTYTWRPKILLGHLYNMWQAFERERAARAFARTAGISTVYFRDHHAAHAASAYYFCGQKNALVVTIDGLGDSLSHTAWHVRGGTWEKLAQGPTGASLGAFYAAVTEGLGFTPNRHEGKVTGLAALDNPQPAEQYLRPLMTLADGARSFRRSGHADMVHAVRHALEHGVSRESIAACAQQILEELVVAHIRMLSEKTGERFVACAGGVFSNVKLNQRILEMLEIDDMFVQPGMGDEGLVLGTPFLHLAEHGVVESTRMPHMYWGNEATESEVRAAAAEYGYAITALTKPAAEVASLIANGEIVGWFDMRMEFGPRALGARSIMADPRNPDINRIINERLRRSEFMPFAPSALYEAAHELFELQGDAGMYAAEFMTITFNVKEEWRHKVPAIVHKDGTARPQLVRHEVNPAYYAVIAAFREMTGVPLVINTSFNIHEEPIVSSAADALRSLESGAVDCVVFNNSLLVRRVDSHKAGGTIAR